MNNFSIQTINKQDYIVGEFESGNKFILKQSSIIYALCDGDTYIKFITDDVNEEFTLYFTKEEKEVVCLFLNVFENCNDFILFDGFSNHKICFFHKSKIIAIEMDMISNTVNLYHPHIKHTELTLENEQVCRSVYSYLYTKWIS
jgi:hypothetical protein